MAKLSDITVTYYAGDYAGQAPVIADCKMFDVARDINTGKGWRYNGSEWIPAEFETSGTIEVGYGDTIAERLESVTVYPNTMICYQGDDNNVPDELRLSAEDLIVYHNFGSRTISADVWAVDGVSAYQQSGLIHQISEDGKWSRFAQFNGVVGSKAAIIKIRV